ncbi:FMRFamide receptor-like [Haliotis rufescens]|uniref:FMRFamide receptor-like n=1 Tax=Haliotis rufescens TaxID=6454 RepID=UPI001EB093E5|nr:FMRFamide receptor-like [Haliotis rufescens]
MEDFNKTFQFVILNLTTIVPSNADNRTYGPSKEFRMELNTFKFSMLGIIGNTLAVFGLLANTLSIIVLRHRKMRSSTAYYLVTLAIYDNVILVAMVVFFGLPALYESMEPSILESYHFNYSYAMPIVYPVSLAAQMASIYTCVAFTIERYIAVCHPLHAANTCTKSRAKKAMLLIFLWSILYNIPRYFHYRVDTKWVDEKNRTQAVAKETEFGSDTVFRQVYLIYFQLIFMFLIPFSILMILNSALIRALRHSHQQRQQMSNSAAREHNLTIMLVAVIVLFLVCQFPSIIDNILMASTERGQLVSNMHYNKFYVMCTFMVEINSATNFIMYCVFGKKFRMVFLHIFGCKKGQRTLQYRSTLYNTRTNGLRSCDMEVSLV